VGTFAVTPENGGATLTIPGRASSPYRVTWLTNPYRLAVDIQGMRLGPAGSSMFVNSGLVIQVRAAQQPGNVVRVVFDLRGPADLRAETRGTALRLVVVPRAPAARPAPRQLLPQPPVMYAPPVAAPPMGVPTPRPLPPYPGYVMPYQIFSPQVVVTPVPITPPMPFPTSAATTQPQAVSVASPAFDPSWQSLVPPPWPSASPASSWQGADGELVKPPASFDEDPFADEVEPPFKTVLGNRVWLGGGLLLNVNEDYARGNSKSTINGVPTLELGAEPLFTRNVGMALGFRMQGYGIQDAAPDQFTGVDRRYLRDEMEAHVGVRGRFDLAPGFEVYAQPQGVFRNVAVSTRGKDNAVLPPEAVIRDEFLVQSHRGFGGGLGLGLGYRINDMFALVGSGEFNYLLGDYLNSPDPGARAVPAIYPMLNYRGGLEARFTLEGFSASLGYKFAAFNNSERGYDHLWHGPAVSVGVQY
jgi:hypothetical protein